MLFLNREQSIGGIGKTERRTIQDSITKYIKTIGGPIGMDDSIESLYFSSPLKFDSASQALLYINNTYMKQLGKPLYELPRYETATTEFLTSLQAERVMIGDESNNPDRKIYFNINVVDALSGKVDTHNTPEFRNAVASAADSLLEEAFGAESIGDIRREEIRQRLTTGNVKAIKRRGGLASMTVKGLLLWYAMEPAPILRDPGSNPPKIA